MNMESNEAIHVVLGTGPLGHAVAERLLAEGKRVRMVNRRGRTDAPAGVEVVAGDASTPGGLRRAMQGAGVLYHCAKPLYTAWRELFPALMDGVIAAAAEAGARVVYADNLYMYGPVAGPLTENLPLRPVGPKGRVRAEMAESLLDADRRGVIRATIGRAPDFYGPRVREAILGERVVRPAVEGGAAAVLGDIDQPHTHIYIEDFARGLVTLGAHEEALGQVWHIPSAPTRTTRELITLLYQEAGNPVRIRTAPRLLVHLLALVDPTFRELREVLYQVERPFVVDASKYERAFGAETTPHREAARRTVAWYREYIRRTGGKT